MEYLNLPIDAFESHILETIEENQVIIITAETGSGKTTRVGPMLLNAGYRRIIHTQPRVLACRSVSQWVAEQMDCTFGGRVGYRTSKERKDSYNTQLLFCTDGLQLVRELAGNKATEILVIDEVHEWNLNIETLVAWSNMRISKGANFKLVLMSATLQAEKLSKYFYDAPVIEVPGRMFPVEVRDTKSTKAEDEVISFLKAGHNVLVFQPGKKEIADTVQAIQKIAPQFRVLPLHGQLTYEEQKACFVETKNPTCIVSTNVAQTSVTIDYIDAVIDSGMERRVETVNGVEGLYLRPISWADADQRKGRAGRCKEGVYIDLCPETNRPDFPVAEIMRVRLDQVVLRLARAGMDAEELEFFHQPDKEQIKEAKRALQALGCMTGLGEVTKTGDRVSLLPISVHHARMIVEAEKRGVVADVMTIAAILEQNGITLKPKPREEILWRRFCQGETDSDVMAQLAVYKAGLKMNPKNMSANGINPKSFRQARETRRHLEKGLRTKVGIKSSGNRVEILKSVCAGMVDHLFKKDWTGYRNGDDLSRQLDRYSVLSSQSEWIVGKPFDLELKDKRSGRPFTLNIINMATEVDPHWLVDIAPQLVEEKKGESPLYALDRDCVFSIQSTTFNGQQILREQVEHRDHPQASEVFVDWLARVAHHTDEIDSPHQEDGAVIKLREILVANRHHQRQVRELNARAGRQVYKYYSKAELRGWIQEQVTGAHCLAEIEDIEVLRLPEPDVATVLRVNHDSPLSIHLLGADRTVHYRVGQSPLVGVTVYSTSPDILNQLPDQGVKLPSGRLVEVCVTIDWTKLISTSDVREIKDALNYRRNFLQFQSWSPDLMSLPSCETLDFEVPPLQMGTCGQCVTTGKGLVAWGSISFHKSMYNDSASVTSFWSLSRDEANKVRERTIADLAEARVDAAEKLKAIQLYPQVELLRDQLNKLFCENSTKCEELKDSDLQYEIMKFAQGIIPMSRGSELEQWIVQAKSILATAEEAIRPKGEFTHAGKRDYLCGNCGMRHTVGKATLREYKAGKPMDIVCAKCGLKETRQMEVATQVEKQQAQKEEHSSADALAKLKNWSKGR